MSTIDVTLRIGDLFATGRPGVIRTVLGSCIAVCLFDPVACVGGMNHFMLPRMVGSDGGLPTRFGVQAMEVLMGALQQQGACRTRIVAKLFGAGHVLKTPESVRSVPARNLKFIEDFVRDEGLRVIGRDLGGYLPRSVRFHPHTGRAFVRRMGIVRLDELRLEEQLVDERACVWPEPDITLF